jgi:hypothetical protein
MVMVMAFSATFNNISVISWRSVLLIGNDGLYISTQVKAEVRKKKVVRIVLFVNEFT